MLNFRTILIGASVAFPASLFAAEDSIVPEGCTAIVSIQTQACEANLIWTCDLAPAGDKWEAYFDAGGVQSIVNYSDQYAWLESRYFWDNSTEVPYGQPVDAISLTALLLMNVDTYDFQMERTDDSGTRILNVVGKDYLTGNEITIDGKLLKEVVYDVTITEADGSLFYKSSGVQYYYPEMSIFVSGLGTWSDPQGNGDFDSTAVKISLPGDPGFANTTPQYGCEAGQESAPADPPSQAPVPDNSGTPDPAGPKPGKGNNSNK